MKTLAPAPTLSDEIRDQIEDHVFSETDREVGGVLVGTLIDGEATIRAAIPALRAEGSAMNVTFTHEVWADVLEIVEREHPDSRIIGWYHSHPGFGLFLSEYDRFIQANFFGEPGMAALVVDPLAGESGWFVCEGDRVEELHRMPTAKPAALVRQSEQTHAGTVRQSRRSRLIAGGAVVTGLVAILGYAVGNLTAPAVITSPGDSGSTSQELAQVQAELDAANSHIAELENQGSTATIAYTVSPGESWWSIAAELTGDGFNYHELKDANPTETGLDPGDVIAVPGVPLASPSA